MGKITANGNVNVGGGTMFDISTRGSQPDVEANFNLNFGDGTVLKLTHTQTIEGVLVDLGWPPNTPKDMLAEAIDVFLKSVGDSDAQKERALSKTRLAEWLQNTANIGSIWMAFKALADSGAIAHIRTLLGI